MKKSTFIAVDWGTTNFRAYQIIDNQCIDKIEAEAGIKQIENKQFDRTLCQLLSPWKEYIEQHNVLIIMGGMIGSDQGWCNTGYQMLPQTLSNIKKGCVVVDSQLKTKVVIKQGIAINTPQKTNVMRGEEIQLIGAFDAGTFDCYLFPGTHSKWVSIDDNQCIKQYHTIMTGELYSILMNYSLLGIGVDKQVNEFAFKLGLQAASSNEDVIENLFYARSAKVLGQLASENVAGWLSGLLIGHEVKSQLNNYLNARKFAIVANPKLGELYQLAFLDYGLNVTLLEPEQTIINGFRSVFNELNN